MARSIISESVSGFLLLLVTLFISKSNAQSFNLVQDSSGSTFFDKWNFAPAVGTFDNTTNGDVFFVTKDQVTSAPQEQKLAFANSNGNAILRVDNFSTVAYPEKRNTVRITSQSLFNVGSLFVTDMLHIPFGCSVWPSFWTQGVNWPQDGEIDIIEGINQNTQNQMALHATAGCMHSQITDPTKQVGNPGELNCNATGNIGCTVLETKPNSFGQSFSQNGGGVFATQFDTTGIFIWYWPRSQIPASIKASTSTSSMSIDDWGAPSASYPNSPDGCDIPKFFDAQSLVLEITLCGDWAGAEYFGVCGQAPPTTTTGTLPPPAPTDVAKTTCYNERVLGPPSGYNDAFFEIQWLRVYAAPNTPAASAASSASSAPQATSSGNSTTGSGGTAGGSDATKFQTQWSILITVIMFWFGRSLVGN